MIDSEIARARGRKPPTSLDGCIRVLDEMLHSVDTDVPSCGGQDEEASRQVEELRTRVRTAAEELKMKIIARARRQSEGGSTTAAPNGRMAMATTTTNGEEMIHVGRTPLATPGLTNWNGYAKRSRPLR